MPSVAPIHEFRNEIPISVAVFVDELQEKFIFDFEKFVARGAVFCLAAEIGDLKEHLRLGKGHEMVGSEVNGRV